MLLARIIIKIKPAILDPQGKAIQTALSSLGIEGFTSVRQSKLIEVEIDNDNVEEVRSILQQATEQILANVIMEDYQIEIEHAPHRTGIAEGETDQG